MLIYKLVSLHDFLSVKPSLNVEITHHNGCNNMTAFTRRNTSVAWTHQGNGSQWTPKNKCSKKFKFFV